MPQTRMNTVFFGGHIKSHRYTPNHTKKRGYLLVTPLLQELVQSALNRPRATTIFLFHELIKSFDDGRRQRDVEPLKAFFFDVPTASASIDTH